MTKDRFLKAIQTIEKFEENVQKVESIGIDLSNFFLLDSVYQMEQLFFTEEYTQDTYDLIVDFTYDNITKEPMIIHKGDKEYVIKDYNDLYEYCETFGKNH